MLSSAAGRRCSLKLERSLRARTVYVPRHLSFCSACWDQTSGCGWHVQRRGRSSACRDATGGCIERGRTWPSSPHIRAGSVTRDATPTRSTLAHSSAGTLGRNLNTITSITFTNTHYLFNFT
eukprot:COSAG02_NODE_41328_length_395_cov_6.682432_1_plen_121_part_10